VKLPASIAACPSASRQKTELAANAIMAAAGPISATGAGNVDLGVSMRQVAGRRAALQVCPH